MQLQHLPRRASAGATHTTRPESPGNEHGLPPRSSGSSRTKMPPRAGTTRSTRSCHTSSSYRSARCSHQQDQMGRPAKQPHERHPAGGRRRGRRGTPAAGPPQTRRKALPRPSPAPPPAPHSNKHRQPLARSSLKARRAGPPRAQQHGPTRNIANTNSRAAEGASDARSGPRSPGSAPDGASRRAKTSHRGRHKNGRHAHTGGHPRRREMGKPATAVHATGFARPCPPTVARREGGEEGRSAAAIWGFRPCRPWRSDAGDGGFSTMVSLQIGRAHV